MRGDPEVAVNAIRTIHDLWKVDADCVEWVGDTSAETIFKSGYGFDWWPGDFRVAIRVHGPHPELDEPVYRLNARTDFLRDVDESAPDFATSLSTLNHWAPTFAICGLPPWVRDFVGEDIPPRRSWLSKLIGRRAAEKPSEPKPRSSQVFLASNAYLIKERAEWLPHYFSALALLQPIESQARAENSIDLLGGRQDRSQAPRRGQRTDLDDMLGFEFDLAKRGKEASAWIGTGEFDGIVDRWCRTETAFGINDNDSLHINLPFGERLAVLRLLTNDPHLRLGGGLLLSLRIPLISGPVQAAMTCVSLNYMESTVWSEQNVPLVGSWCVGAALNADGGYSYAPEFKCFIPNMMYREGIAEMFAIYMIKRARWARQRLLPDVVDAPMTEILLRELPASGTA